MNRRVLYLIVCGAGPTMHAPHFATAACDAGWDCHLTPTPAGAAFLDYQAAETASGNPVIDQHRKPGQPRRSRPSADALVIAPATANTVCKLGAGIADDYALDIAAELIGLAVPTLIVPFANTALTGRAPYRRALASLKDEGVAVYDLPEHAPHQGRPIAEHFPWAAILDRLEAVVDAAARDR